MTWVTWRQHRQEGLWALLAVAILAGCMAVVIYELGVTPCPAAVGNSYCFHTDLLGSLAKWIVRYNLYQYGLVVFPALVGAFIGAPLVAREIENGTHRLAWTQGTTRARWLFVKLGLVFIPLLAGAAVVGILEVLLVNAQGPQSNHWAFFDQQAPVTVAATAFALALGVAAGSLIGKSIPAMAATLLVFVVTRVAIAELARPYYMNPLQFNSHDPSFDAGRAVPTAWVLDPQTYQPADRFWTFQTIEAAILMVLAAVILGFAAYWVARRVT